MVDIIDNVINNIKDLSDKRDWFQAYYETITKATGLNECITFVKNKKQKKNNYKEIEEKFDPKRNEEKYKIIENELVKDNASSVNPNTTLSASVNPNNNKQKNFDQNSNNTVTQKKSNEVKTLAKNDDVIKDDDIKFEDEFDQ